MGRPWSIENIMGWRSRYAMVDIFVYPRHAMRLPETVTPLKSLEAMAGGGLVVASDAGGHRELIRDGETGHLFRAGNLEALARTIAGLVMRQHEWGSIRLNARRFVEQERSWAASVSGYAQAYSRALQKKRQRH